MNFERGQDPKVFMGIGSKLARAKTELEARRKKAYEDIKAKGDEVLGDNSFIGTNWSTGDPMPFLCITTKQMIEDLKNMKSIDPAEELEKELDKYKNILMI